MSEITLESIKTEQERLAKMIYEFESISRKRTITIPGVEIILRSGESYAGIVLGKDGKPIHHLILDQEVVSGVSWMAAMDWAIQQKNLSLPSRKEQSLLFANLRNDLKTTFYWSCETECAPHTNWAQNFRNGDQIVFDESRELHAMAVRRIPIVVF